MQAAVITSRIEAPQLPGTWKLPAGRAVTLRPSEDGRLKVAHGLIWATYDGPHRGARNNLGDHVVGAGEELHLRAGDRLVVESWHSDAPAYFSWDPAPAQQAAQTLRVAGVVQPMKDLRAALALGAGAITRLVDGVARLAWQSVAGRRETVEERACRQRGVMG